MIWSRRDREESRAHRRASLHRRGRPRALGRRGEGSSTKREDEACPGPAGRLDYCWPVYMWRCERASRGEISNRGWEVGAVGERTVGLELDALMLLWSPSVD